MRGGALLSSIGLIIAARSAEFPSFPLSFSLEALMEVSIAHALYLDNGQRLGPRISWVFS